MTEGAGLEGQVPYDNATMYLLLTTRHQLEGEQSLTMDPNARIVMEGQGVGGLIKQASDRMFDPVGHLRPTPARGVAGVAGAGASGGVGRSGVGSSDGVGEAAVLSEAWTSLRISSGYRYPTHIDCFENMIYQVQGEKTVRLIDPAAVAMVRPDPGRKHWPQGSQAELDKAAELFGRTVRLYPGDQVGQWLNGIRRPPPTVYRPYATASRPPITDHQPTTNN